ncbi:MAG: hypothetical protein WB615_01290 [Candidatus Tumulicola sp.]
MSRTSVAVRVVAAIGLTLVVFALAFAVSNGRLFLLPFLLIVGFPMAAVFRPRRPPLPPPSDGPSNPSSRMSLN